MFVLYPKKVSLIKYNRYKNIQMEYGEPFYKKIACLHVLNPLSANLTKWSDTHRQLVGNSQRIV